MPCRKHGLCHMKLLCSFNSYISPLLQECKAGASILRRVPVADRLAVVVRVGRGE